MKVGDEVEHVHYPGTMGVVKRVSGSIVFVQWKGPELPRVCPAGDTWVDQRTSRHISTALQYVVQL